MSWAYKLFVTSLVTCHKIHSLLCIGTFLASAPPVMAAAAAAAAGYHNSSSHELWDSHFRESLFLRFELCLAVWNLCHDHYCTFISVTKIISDRWLFTLAVIFPLPHAYLSPAFIYGLEKKGRLADVWSEIAWLNWVLEQCGSSNCWFGTPIWLLVLNCRSCPIELKLVTRTY